MVEENEAEGSIMRISSIRDRAARYRESAAHFERLAETEPVEAIRDHWQGLARDYAYLARILVL